MTYIPRSSSGKNGVSSSIPRVVKKKRTFRIFSFIGTVMIVASVLGVAGVFFLEDVANAQLEEAKIRLTEVSNEAGDSQEKINEIRAYDEKLKIASNLLDNHLAPSLLFDALELNTTQTIQYKKFEYDYDPGFDAILTIYGGTEEFTSVVSQRMQFDSIDSPFEIAVLDDLTREQNQESTEDDEPLYESGEVSFSVKGLLKKARFMYSGEEVVPQEDQVSEGESVLEEEEPSDAEDEVLEESDQGNQ